MPTLPESLPRPKPEYDIPSLAELTAGEKARVSYSELSTFRDCPLKWLLKYAYRLQPPERPLRLDRGTAWHKMLEAHYNTIRANGSRDETRKAVYLALNDYSDEIGGMAAEEFETLTWMYDDYVRIYRNDFDYEVVCTEDAFEFPFPVEGAPNLVIVGRIDLETIERETGIRAVWDHKSASGRDVSKDGFLNEMLLEDQFILYAWAKREAGTPVANVIYNAARTDRLKRKMLDSERYSRVKIPYSDRALDQVYADNLAAATALVRMWNDPTMTYSVPNPRQCGWKCDYQRPHIEARNAGRNVAAVALDYGYTLRPPGDLPVELEADSEASPW